MSIMRLGAACTTDAYRDSVLKLSSSSASARVVHPTLVLTANVLRHGVGHQRQPLLQSNMRTYRGSLRNKYDFPKSVTTYSYMAATASTNEAVSRILQERDVYGGGMYVV